MIENDNNMLEAEKHLDEAYDMVAANHRNGEDNVMCASILDLHATIKAK